MGEFSSSIFTAFFLDLPLPSWDILRYYGSGCWVLKFIRLRKGTHYMIFFASLIALIAERFFHWGQLRQWRWFETCQSWFNTKINHSNPSMMLAVYVLPIAIAIGIVSWILCPWWMGLLHILFGAAVLLYCLGPGNLWADAYQVLADFSKGDMKQGKDYAQTAFGVSTSGNASAFHKEFLRILLIASNRRVFAVVFWFVLLGPMGAFIYRGIDLCSASDKPTGVMALKIQGILDWVPARLLAFIFALTGNFSKVFTCWLPSLKKGQAENDVVLVACGMAALDSVSQTIPEDGSAEKELMQLMDRALIMVLALIAVVAIAV